MYLLIATVVMVKNIYLLIATVVMVKKIHLLLATVVMVKKYIFINSNSCYGEKIYIYL